MGKTVRDTSKATEDLTSTSFGGVSRTIPAHSSRAFETELRELRAQLLAMGARCERIVGLACERFCPGSPGPAGAVERLDAQIDRDELEIHALILRILALRQPVANDLRFLTTALRLVTDLERIGDEAVNVGKRAEEPQGAARGQVETLVTSMANDARDMLHEALEAFVQRDDGRAEQVLARDDAVDARCAEVIEKMVVYMSTHSAEVGPGLCVIRVAKYLERIADHATNVAEEVIFMVSAEDVRHGHWRAKALRQCVR